MVLTAYFVISPAIGFLVTVALRKMAHPARLGVSASARLDAGTEASGPHVFAVRLKYPRQEHHPRPPHPSPALMTLRNAPLSGTGWR